MKLTSDENSVINIVVTVAGMVRRWTSRGVSGHGYTDRLWCELRLQSFGSKRGMVMPDAHTQIFRYATTVLSSSALGSAGDGSQGAGERRQLYSKCGGHKHDAWFALQPCEWIKAV